MSLTDNLKKKKLLKLFKSLLIVQFFPSNPGTQEHV